MATIPRFNKAALDRWVATRPKCIQKLCKILPADRLYRLKGTKDRVTIRSYNENGTVTVSVLGKYNFVIFERDVFGIKPSHLKECDLPAPDEKLGVMLTKQNDIDGFIAKHREEIIKLGRS